MPLLERLRFLAFCSRNLDEFFMVRVGATRDLIDAGIAERTPDGLLPAEQMAAMRQRTRELLGAICIAASTSSCSPSSRASGIVIERLPRSRGGRAGARSASTFASPSRRC